MSNSETLEPGTRVRITGAAFTGFLATVDAPCRLTELEPGLIGVTFDRKAADGTEGLFTYRTDLEVIA